MNAKRLNRIAMRILTTGSFVAAVALAPSLAKAWGPVGHAMVADIAEAHLTPQAQAMVRDLLGSEGHTHLSEIASWADDVRSSVTAPWHFTDIPRQAAAFDQARDCAKICSVVALVRQINDLSNPAAAPERRELALKWVVHIVGDLHQPLHNIDDGDKGGNQFLVGKWATNYEANLHYVWDSGLIRDEFGLRGESRRQSRKAASFVPLEAGQDVRDAALTLDRTFSRPVGAQAQFIATEEAAITKSPLDRIEIWSNEAHQLAQKAYNDAARDMTMPGEFETAYLTDEKADLHFQIESAGLRLAAILNVVAEEAGAR